MIFESAKIAEFEACLQRNWIHLKRFLSGLISHR